MGAAYELPATVREKVGKGAARSTRGGGQVPAVVYGGKEPTLAIALPFAEVDQKVRGGGFFTTLATIDVGDEKIRVIPRDYQLDPVSEKLLHIDFLRVEEGARLTIDVPVNFINEEEAPGIRRGGVLNIVRHTVNVSCPVDAIPEELICDLTGLDINDSVHISAMTLPEGVQPTVERDFTVATIAAPAGVKEEIRAAAEAAAAAAEAGEGEEGAEAAAPGEAEGGEEAEAEADKE